MNFMIVPIRAILCGGLALSGTVAHALPEIDIGSALDFVEPTASYAVKRVTNKGDEPAFVEISVLEMRFNPQTGETEEVPVRDVAIENFSDDESTQRGVLVASPSRMIIPARGHQLTRLLFLGSRETEQSFRVRYEPDMSTYIQKASVQPSSASITAPAGKRTGLTKTSNVSADQSTTPGIDKPSVQISLGYGSIVTVRPRETKFDTRIEERDDAHMVVNRGNSSVMLDFLYTCDASGEKCRAPRQELIRPQRGFQLPKSQDLSYSFTLVEGATRTPMRVNNNPK